ncbi:MAG: DNA polymerase III subunit delta [Flavobacteriaceae bacterium]
MQAYYTLLSEIQKKQFVPFYLLSGTEPFYIDSILSSITDSLIKEESRDFDYSLFYGKEVVASEIIETAKRFPLIAEYNLVVVKEVQTMNPSVWEELASYAENPMPNSIVILCFKHKAFDKRKKLYKAAEKKGRVLTVRPLYDNQIVNWIGEHAQKLKVNISPTAATLLAEHIGAKMSHLDKELKKLKLVVREGETLEADHIEKHVGISKEFNSFELQRAIGFGQFSKAFQIVQYFNQNPKNHPLVLILSTLHNYFQKLLLYKGLPNSSDAPKVLGVNPFFIKDYQVAAQRLSMRQITVALGHILDADLRSKGIQGVNETPQRILESLLLKLFSV